MEHKTPANEYDLELNDKVFLEQDAIETKAMKERAHRIANLRRIREGLIDTYESTADPGIKLSLWDVVGHLKNLEQRIIDGIE